MYSRIFHFVLHYILIVNISAVFYGYDRNEEPLKEFYNNEPLSRPFSDYLNIREMEDWGKDCDEINKLGQVAGVAADKGDIVYIFHRGDVIWDSSAFDENNMYRQAGNGPISKRTVLILNGTNGNVINSWGENRFYMPHGISLDPEGNVWLTDVALHQVFRFKKGEWDSPELILGEAFVSGNDEDHFCKPTDVAVSSTGMVYISDGYCNSRIVIVSPDGRMMGEIGMAENMLVPHSLTLMEDEDLICVADREKMRILCYNAGLTPSSNPGALMFELKHPKLGRVFAIDHIGDDILAINVAGLTNGFKSNGITIDLATEQVQQVWGPKGGFEQPHDLSVTPDGKCVYVTEISTRAPKKIHKFHTYNN